jgi:hypothetical protein
MAVKNVMIHFQLDWASCSICVVCPLASYYPVNNGKTWLSYVDLPILTHWDWLNFTEKIGFKAPSFQDGFSCGRIFA